MILFWTLVQRRENSAVESFVLRSTWPRERIDSWRSCTVSVKLSTSTWICRALRQ